ncbi:helix-turn-helix domain-containing protein [Providencia alcalifaciens]
MDLNDEVFDVKKAADFLCKSERTVYALLKSGRIRAARSDGKKGCWEILKSSCLEYVHNNHQNQQANGDDADKSTEGFKGCPSNKGTEFGTVISFRQTASALDKALERRTSDKRKSCMTS